MLKSFHKYYLIHKNENIYPEMNCTTVKMYNYILISFLKKNLIIPDEEMMTIIKNFFSITIFKERDSAKGKEVFISSSNDQDRTFEIKSGINYQCFIKHCFSYKGIFKNKDLVDKAMQEYSKSDIIIKGDKFTLQPKIVIKIKEYIYTSEIFSPKKLYSLGLSLFNDFFEKNNLNLKQSNLNTLRNIITNMIVYGSELTQLFIPYNMLIYALYFIKDLDKIDEKKENKNDNNNKKNEKNEKNNLESILFSFFH